MKVLKSDYKYRHSYKKILCKKGVDKKAEMDKLLPPPEFFANKRVSALSLNKKTNRKTILKNNFRQGAGGFK